MRAEDTVMEPKEQLYLTAHTRPAQVQTEKKSGHGAHPSQEDTGWEREPSFLHWGVNASINHTPGQAPCQHVLANKTKQTPFLYVHEIFVLL